MANLKHKPVPHNHKAFLRKAKKRRGFQAAYDALAVEYAIANQMLAARSRAGLTQEAVATRMGTSKSTVSRLESAGKHTPSLSSIKRYAEAVGCKIEVRLIPQK
jgi:DNA-binding XRE family transcriptional regulator